MKLLRLSLAAAALAAAVSACDASRIAAPRTPPAGPARDGAPPVTTSDYTPPPLPPPTDTTNRVGQTMGSGG